MLAFRDCLETKAEALANVRKHAAADRLVKGKYWENGKGCAVGCHYNKYWHRQGRSKYAGLSGLGWHELAEKVHGIPFELAALEDCIFENLPNNLAMTWPERFITAIPEGADLSKVWPRFAHWLLVDSQDGVIRFADAETGEAIWGVAMLFAREIADEIPSDEEWEAAGAAAGAAAWVAARAAAWEAAGAAARAAARAAAWEAAGAAAWAAAGAAARAAAWEAAWEAARAAARAAAWEAAGAAAWAAAGAAARAAAWEAAGAAAWAAAWKAAWEAAILRQSEKLLELLSTAPVNASV